MGTRYATDGEKNVVESCRTSTTPNGGLRLRPLWPNGIGACTAYPKTGCLGYFGPVSRRREPPPIRALAWLGLVEHIPADTDSRSAMWRYIGSS